MKLNIELIEKTFTDEEGKIHPYNVLAYTLYDNSKLELPIKSDKAKLIRLSENMSKMPSLDKDIWEDR